MITMPTTSAPRLRVLQVLGFAGVEGGRAGITGVERVVELLLEGMDAARFEQYVAYPGTGAQFERFQAYAADVLPCEPRRRYDRVYVQTLARFIVQNKVDVVVSHGHRYDFLSALACRSLRVPHVVSRAVALADEPMPRWRRALYMFVDAWTLRGCHAIIAVSEASKRRMHETQGIPLDRIHVVYNGVRTPAVTATERREARRALGVADDAILVGGAGQFIARKSFDVLIRALGRLSVPDGSARVASDVVAVLIGDGPEREKLDALARQQGVRLVLPGYAREPYALMAALDVAVLPSLAEGMPLVVLETMALGVPNIATNVAGTPEVIEDGKCGLLVPPSDVDALASALRRFVEDPELRRRLGEAGRQRVRDSFGIEAMAAGFERCLTQIVTEARHTCAS